MVEIVVIPLADQIARGTRHTEVAKGAEDRGLGMDIADRRIAESVDPARHFIIRAIANHDQLTIGVGLAAVAGDRETRREGECTMHMRFPGAPVFLLVALLAPLVLAGAAVPADRPPAIFICLGPKGKAEVPNETAKRDCFLPRSAYLEWGATFATEGEA